MALQIGDRAIDFTLSTKTAEGPQKVSLGESWKAGTTVLFFFPMAYTGVCTEEFCQLSSERADYEGLEAKVYGISGDNPFAQEAWAQKEGISIPLLSDYEHLVARAYGVAYDSFLPQINLGMGGVAKRSAFIIDRKGIIQYAEVNDDPGKVPNFAAIKEKLQQLKANVAAAAGEA